MSMKIFIGTKSNSNYKVKYTACWDVESLELFFASKELPATLKLNKWTVIDNVKNFITAHLEFLKSNNGNLLYLPYYERLMELKSLID